MNSKTIKTPANEQIWVSHRSTDGELMFLITSKSVRDFYYLYEVLPNGANKKLGRAKSPKELEEKFDVISKLYK